VLALQVSATCVGTSGQCNMCWHFRSVQHVLALQVSATCVGTSRHLMRPLKPSTVTVYIIEHTSVVQRNITLSCRMCSSQSQLLTTMAFVTPASLPGRALRQPWRRQKSSAPAHMVSLARHSVPIMVASTPGPPKVSPVPTSTEHDGGPVEVLELTLENVEMVLDEMRPYLISDGGNVSVADIDGATVRLQLEGACGSCPSSTMTMKMGLVRLWHFQRQIYCRRSMFHIARS
jgi:Fe-S cluster biogenesis protein NfuA